MKNIKIILLLTALTLSLNAPEPEKFIEVGVFESFGPFKRSLIKDEGEFFQVLIIGTAIATPKSEIITPSSSEADCSHLLSIFQKISDSIRISSCQYIKPLRDYLLYFGYKNLIESSYIEIVILNFLYLYSLCYMKNLKFLKQTKEELEFFESIKTLIGSLPIGDLKTSIESFEFNVKMEQFSPNNFFNYIDNTLGFLMEQKKPEAVINVLFSNEQQQQQQRAEFLNHHQTIYPNGFILTLNSDSCSKQITDLTKSYEDEYCLANSSKTIESSSKDNNDNPAQAQAAVALFASESTESDEYCLANSSKIPKSSPLKQTVVTLTTSVPESSSDAHRRFDSEVDNLRDIGVAVAQSAKSAQEERERKLLNSNSAQRAKKAQAFIEQQEARDKEEKFKKKLIALKAAQEKEVEAIKGEQTKARKALEKALEKAHKQQVIQLKKMFEDMVMLRDFETEKRANNLVKCEKEARDKIAMQFAFSLSKINSTNEEEMNVMLFQALETADFKYILSSLTNFEVTIDETNSKVQIRFVGKDGEECLINCHPPHGSQSLKEKYAAWHLSIKHAIREHGVKLKASSDNAEAQTVHHKTKGNPVQTVQTGKQRK